MLRLLGSLLLLTSVHGNDDKAIKFRKCVNFQSSYAGSWIAKDDMFMKTKWVGIPASVIADQFFSYWGFRWTPR